MHLPRSWEPQDLPSAPKQGPKVLSAYSHTAEAGCQGQDVLPQAQLVANCEKVKPSQTHRGPHRRGVTTSRGRATHCDQRHRAGPGHLGEHPARPLPQPTVSPRLRTTRKERLELLGPGTSSGAALKGPDSRPVGSHRAGTERRRPLPSALGSARPVLAGGVVEGGAEGGAQVRNPDLTFSPGFGRYAHGRRPALLAAPGKIT